MPETASYSAYSEQVQNSGNHSKAYSEAVYLTGVIKVFSEYAEQNKYNSQRVQEIQNRR